MVGPPLGPPVIKDDKIRFLPRGANTTQHHTSERAQSRAVISARGIILYLWDVSGSGGSRMRAPVGRRRRSATARMDWSGEGSIGKLLGRPSSARARPREPRKLSGHSGRDKINKPKKWGRNGPLVRSPRDKREHQGDGGSVCVGGASGGPPQVSVRRAQTRTHSSGPTHKQPRAIKHQRAANPGDR